ncbi:Uncharacterised protein [Chlamydia trachomatis]|nr:Uncharacterised protein [Chlamydia trachomatis]CRH46793.1 Uncharacterised protein [Chlamydia trachomatis]CRH54567.1 Uncharacterised protein [Chlamydia trachomatis]
MIKPSLSAVFLILKISLLCINNLRERSSSPFTNMYCDICILLTQISFLLLIEQKALSSFTFCALKLLTSQPSNEIPASYVLCIS